MQIRLHCAPSRALSVRNMKFVVTHSEAYESAGPLLCYRLLMPTEQVCITHAHNLTYRRAYTHRMLLHLATYGLSDRTAHGSVLCFEALSAQRKIHTYERAPSLLVMVRNVQHIFNTIKVYANIPG